MKRYRVIGRCPVFGHKTNQIFSAELSDSHEARLLKAGHIAVVKTPKKQAAPDADEHKGNE